MNCFSASASAGSSPLTRGKHVDCDAIPRLQGLIPAHAGKTARRRTSRVLRRAHPRSRGENSCGRRVLLPGRGSSPLTRGKRYFCGARRATAGLIPAHAGKTRDPARRELKRRAHPRSRGENDIFGNVDGGRLGSSPLTRGKHEAGATKTLRIGLIPAHAGKTLAERGREGHPAAHPRSRGENNRMSEAEQNRVGSSPLTRGKLPAPSASWICTGLIPAHAGKTSASTRTTPRARAHPRSRGENAGTAVFPPTTQGSSPLTRGKLRITTPAERRHRLIPAHAGKTPPRRPARHQRRAHPRSRGEN